VMVVVKTDVTLYYHLMCLSLLPSVAML